jgi:hypothetical protein
VQIIDLQHNWKYWKGLKRGLKNRPGCISKSEFRNPKFETISNAQNPNDRNGTPEISIADIKSTVLNIGKFEFEICFGFGASDFEFMAD